MENYQVDQEANGLVPRCCLRSVPQFVLAYDLGSVLDRQQSIDRLTGLDQRLLSPEDLGLQMALHRQQAAGDVADELNE